MTTNSLTPIDNILTNDIQMAKLTDSWIVSNNISDHIILLHSVDYNAPSVKNVEVSSGLVNNDRTLANFVDTLSSIDWDMIINNLDAELAFSQFYGKYMEAVPPYHTGVQTK